VIEQIEIAAKYSGYIDRQKGEVERAAHYENLKLPADLDYMQVTALSFEVRQKLSKHRPETLGWRPASPASRRRPSRCCWST
jgi:tRNA uridine 5-carboxymethylaminomethyl modification enzyme